MLRVCASPVMKFLRKLDFSKETYIFQYDAQPPGISVFQDMLVRPGTDAE